MTLTLYPEIFGLKKKQKKKTELAGNGKFGHLCLVLISKYKAAIRLN